MENTKNNAPEFDESAFGSSLDLASLLSFLGQFGETRKHILRAGLEVLFAVRSALDSIIESLEKDHPNLRQKWEFLYLMQYGLSFLANRMAKENANDKSSSQEKNAHKVAALESILEVIDREMDHLSAGINHAPHGSDKGEKSAEVNMPDERQIQMGAMLAIKKVLEREINNAKGNLKKAPTATVSKTSQTPKRSTSEPHKTSSSHAASRKSSKSDDSFKAERKKKARGAPHARKSDE